MHGQIVALGMIWNQSCSVTCQSWTIHPWKSTCWTSNLHLFGFNMLIFWGVYRNHLRLLDDSTGSWYFTCPLIKEGDDPGSHCRFGDQHWARLLVESLLVTNLNHQPLHSTPPKRLTAGYPKNDGLEDVFQYFLSSMASFLDIYLKFQGCVPSISHPKRRECRENHRLQKCRRRMGRCDRYQEGPVDSPPIWKRKNNIFPSFFKGGFFWLGRLTQNVWYYLIS